MLDLGKTWQSKKNAAQDKYPLGYFTLSLL